MLTSTLPDKHSNATFRLLLPVAFALFLLAFPLLLYNLDTSAIRGHFITPTTFPKQHNQQLKQTRIRPNATGFKLQSPTWIQVGFDTNYTSTLMLRWLAPKGQQCRNAHTANISVPGIDGRRAPVVLAVGEIHEFRFVAVDEEGRERCLGGDYFELDLAGELWKSRPPVVDHGNGTYSFKVQVHPNFAGEFNLSVTLLFRSFEGLKFSPVRFAFRKELRRTPTTFRRISNIQLPKLQQCRSTDFSREVWSGRWTRLAGNNACEISNDGRYRCLAPNHKCREPWCYGPLGSLESNGWVYSAHCSFKIFTQNDAWNCLRGRWLFFWGDSNHVDTIRNLLNFVLGLPEIEAVPRRFDRWFVNPRNRSESVRITSIFNGHWNDTKNYEGLNSLRNEEFQNLLWRYFTEETAPDVMILNSGLHDGIKWLSIRAFTQGADFAVNFWSDILSHLKKTGKKRPAVFYRTTIATGGYARDLAFNPSKMEAFNGVLVEKLNKKGLLDSGGVIDQFDMTFPWHFDNRCNDGVHYGRAPAKLRWKDGEIGHQYFVDLMLGHVLLNAICSSQQRGW